MDSLEGRGERVKRRNWLFMLVPSFGYFALLLCLAVKPALSAI
jgi:hypothetical protein